jgi:hypothetical protein
VVSRQAAEIAQKEQLSHLILGQNNLRGSISNAISTSETRLMRRNISQTASIVQLQKTISSRHTGLVSHQADMITRLGNVLENGLAKLEDQLTALKSIVIQSSAPVSLDRMMTRSEDVISAIIYREMR